MFTFNIVLKLPIKNLSTKTLYNKSWNVTKNKRLDFDIEFNPVYLFSIFFNWSTHQSHSGVHCAFELFGLCLVSELYDTRHWDYTNNKWLEPIPQQTSELFDES